MVREISVLQNKFIYIHPFFLIITQLVAKRMTALGDQTTLLKCVDQVEVVEVGSESFWVGF
jgi:hypothetical protein